MSKLNSQSPDPDAFVNSISDINPNFENQISLVSQKIDDNPKLKNLYMRLEQYKEKYKQELIEKIEANVDLLEDSLYKPVIIDLLKNYIEWLFTDDFYVDDKEAIDFPYYISSECEAYVRPASTVLKSLEISKKVIDVYNTKDISRMEKLKF